MTPEERISALESELASMKATFDKAINRANFLGGSERIFQAATLTLVAAYPHKAEFRKVFLAIAERTLANALAESLDEDHLQAIEAARTLVLQHLDME